MWAHAIVAALGLWTMAAPAALGFGDAGEINARIVGPVVAAASTIALWEVTRSLRWVNVAAGVWLALSGPFLGGGTAAVVNAVVTGLAVAGLSIVRGRRRDDFGGGWSSLWRGPTVSRGRDGEGA